MRIAILYDIHGNIHALDAVLMEARATQPDLIVVGGDVASGPFPLDTIERLMQLPVPARFVMGNADREIVVAFESEHTDQSLEPDTFGTRWVGQQLRIEHIEFLQAFEPTIVLDIDQIGPVLFCHGSPRSDEEVMTPATPDAKIVPMLEGVTASLVVCGHTHMQFDREVSGVRIVNAGSVGMPYESAPGAYWAMLDETIELRRTAYDLELAATTIRMSEWPQAREFADENVVTIPTPEEAIAAFERPGE